MTEKNLTDKIRNVYLGPCVPVKDIKEFIGEVNKYLGFSEEVYLNADEFYVIKVDYVENEIERLVGPRFKVKFGEENYQNKK